ncbi:thiamine phosphate synthase, partial [Myxococcus sp. AM011]
PVVGIGGVGLENVASVAATGVHGAAVVSDVLLAQDIAERVRLLTGAFERGRVGG